MSEIPLCSILISSQLPLDDIESLETSLSFSSIKVQKSPNRVLGVDDVVLFITVASTTAQLIDYSIKAAKSINNWRQKLREKGIEPKGKLQHPKRPYLDLRTATDEEIEAWLSHK